ncbi:spermatogenesis-associated protein 31D4-like [Ochotona curzoniae]|uniref:spermatogenesis-associated protein 31D4-like n=1 Tax=Ochotona curzoniae TaxID=130825 RepID=UPI001B35310D|nr:spermatogenesis-associated protein 31D4-like [Ochotona curzoniae]
METLLLFLKSYLELLVSFSSTFIDNEFNHAVHLVVISGLVIMFVYSGYRVLKLFFTKVLRKKNMAKCRGRAKRRRKGGTHRGSRMKEKEAEEGRKLLYILKSSLSQCEDVTSVRHLLCPDARCIVCNRAAAKVSRLLSLGSLLDDTSSKHYMTSSTSPVNTTFTAQSAYSETHPRARTSVSLPVPSAPPPSTISLSRFSSLPDKLIAEPLADSVPPEPILPVAGEFPVAPSPPQTPSLSPPAPQRSQKSDHGLDQQTSLPVVNGPDELSTDNPPISDIDHSMPESREQVPVKTSMDLFPSNLEQDSVKQELLARQSPDRESVSYFVEPTHLSFVSLNDITHLEKQIKQKGECLMQKERQSKMKPFPKQVMSAHQLDTSEKITESGAAGYRPAVSPDYQLRMLESDADKHDSAMSAKHQLDTSVKVLESDADKHDSAMSAEHQLDTSVKVLESDADKHDSAMSAKHQLDTSVKVLESDADKHDSAMSAEHQLDTSVKVLESDADKHDLAIMSDQRLDTSAKILELEAEKPESAFHLDPQLRPPEPMLASGTEEHSGAVSLYSGDSKREPAELHMHQQPPSSKTFENQSPKKCIQHFWGMPTLHSESLYPVIQDADNCLSTWITFNGIAKCPISEGFVISYRPKPRVLPETQPQLLPQTLSPSQSEHKPPPSIPMLPTSPLAQMRICGVCFHRPQIETQSLLPSEIHRLEYNVLQKEQENLWGLPPLVQKSREYFCLPPPNPPPLSQFYNIHKATSILPGNYPLSPELRKKLEHHLRKRLIQHRWGLPRRVNESLTLFRPVRESAASEISDSESSHGHRQKWVSLLKDQSTKDLKSSEFSQTSFSSESGSEKRHSARVRKKKQRHSPKSGPSDSLLEESSDNTLWFDSEEDPESHRANLSENISRASGVSVHQKQLENALKEHLSKKLEEIREGRIPETVNSSWHAIKQALSVPETSQSSVKQTDAAPGVARSISLNTSQVIYFLGSEKQKLLEDHMNSFCKRSKWGFPFRVLESMQISSGREDSSQSLGHTHCSISENLISAVSPLGTSKSFGSSPPFHGHKLKPIRSVPNLDQRLPPASLVGKDGQGEQRKQSLKKKPELVDVQMKGGRQTQTDEETRRKTEQDNRPYSKLVSAIRDGSGPEPKKKVVDSSDKEERHQLSKTKPLECFPDHNKSREIFKANELFALRSKSTCALATSTSLGADVKIKQEETTLITKIPTPTIAVSPNPKVTDFKTQLMNELKLKLESRDHSQFQGQSADMAVASDNSTPKSLLTAAQSVPSRDVAASQIMHVHLDNTKVNVEQNQEPWVPKFVLQNCWDNTTTPSSKKQSSLPAQTGELGEGDAGLGTSQQGKKSSSVQDKACKEMHGSRTSPSLSGQNQPPPESVFQKHMKNFLQWFCPGSRPKGKGFFLGNGSSSLASVQAKVKRASPTSSPKTPAVTINNGKAFEVKVGHSHGVRVACSQAPLSSLPKSVKTQKAQPSIQAEPVQARACKHKAASSTLNNTGSFSQKAPNAGQNYPSKNILIKVREGHLQEIVAFKDQPPFQRHPLTMHHVESVPHASHSCRHHINHMSVLGDPDQLCKHKMFCQHFQAGRFPPPK